MISPFLLLFSFSDPSDCDNRRTDNCGYDNFGHKYVPSFAYPLIHSGNGLNFGFVTFTTTGSFPFGHPRGQRQFFVGLFAHSQDRSRQIAFMWTPPLQCHLFCLRIFLLRFNFTSGGSGNHRRFHVQQIGNRYFLRNQHSERR